MHSAHDVFNSGLRRGGGPGRVLVIAHIIQLIIDVILRVLLNAYSGFQRGEESLLLVAYTFV